MKAYAKNKIVFFIFLITFFLGSCGYRTATHSLLIDSIKTVYVETPSHSEGFSPKNLKVGPSLEDDKGDAQNGGREAQDYYLSQYLQKVVINELKAHNIKVVQQKSQALGLIETNITHYSVDAALFDKEGSPIIYRCTITVNLTLKDKDGKALISNKALTSFEDFKANNLEDALKIANSLLMQKVLNRLAVLIREDLFVNF